MKIEINKTDAYLQQVNDRYHQFAMRELKLYMMQKEDMDISIIENQKRLMKQSKKIVSEFNRKPTLEGCKQIYINAAEIEKAIASNEPDAAKRRRQAWNVLCQVVIAANEFIYVR